MTQKAERGRFGRAILTRRECVDYISTEDVLLAITIHLRRHVALLAIVSSDSMKFILKANQRDRGEHTSDQERNPKIRCRLFDLACSSKMNNVLARPPFGQNFPDSEHKSPSSLGPSYVMTSKVELDEYIP